MEADKKGEPKVEVTDAVSVMAADATTADSVSVVSEEDQNAVKEPSKDTLLPLNSYQIKPLLLDKFKAGPVKEVIRNVLTDILTGQAYNSEAAKKWTIQIANEINGKVRDLKLKRYKHIAQVVLGELKGAGVKSGVRCLWDSDTDGYTSDIFMNDTIFCVAVVFAVYLY